MKKKDEDKPIVWIKCRAREACEGNSARKISHRKLQGGGHITNYRCLTCNHIFVLRV